MKNTLMTIGFMGILGLTSALGYPTPSYAGNSNVESTVEGMGDLSMFYQAMLNTGVINELSESEHYTIFAPTNAALARVSRDNYPCFYSTQCRPQIAALLRNHIIVGRHDLADLKTYGQGLPTLGDKRLHVEEAYVGDYRVEGQPILSESESGGNIVYRVQGIITSPQELAQFQTVSFTPANTITTEKTVVRQTAPTPYPYAYPAGSMVAQPDNLNNNQTETTTITRTYTTEQ